MIFNQFFSLSYVGIDLFYLLYFIICQRIFLTPWKNFPEWCLSVTVLWVRFLIDHLCAYIFANSHHTVLDIIGSVFSTCSLFYHCWFRVASSTWTVFGFGKTTRWRFQASSESDLEVCR